MPPIFSKHTLVDQRLKASNEATSNSTAESDARKSGARGSLWTLGVMANRRGADMYSGFKLCPDLKAKEKCFRVQRYKEGTFEETFHEHVPRHRISLDSELEALRGLVDHCAGWPPTYILRSRLNKRGGGPSQYPGYRSHVEYPEPGVIRRYFSSGPATAWSDEVIVPASFRRDAAVQRKRAKT